MAEASGSRTHRRRGASPTGFEDQARHRPELASNVIVASGRPGSRLDRVKGVDSQERTVDAGLGTASSGLRAQPDQRGVGSMIGYPGMANTQGKLLEIMQALPPKKQAKVLRYATMLAEKLKQTEPLRHQCRHDAEEPTALAQERIVECPTCGERVKESLLSIHYEQEHLKKLPMDRGSLPPWKFKRGGLCNGK